MRIFLDDERSPPEDELDWIVVRSVHALLELISKHSGAVVEISFDNDLQSDLEGRHALGHIVGDALRPPADLPRLERITIHSANVVAAETMMAMVHAAIKHGQIRPVEVRLRSALRHVYPIHTQEGDEREH